MTDTVIGIPEDPEEEARKEKLERAKKLKIGTAGQWTTLAEAFNVLGYLPAERKYTMEQLEDQNLRQSCTTRYLSSETAVRTLEWKMEHQRQSNRQQSVQLGDAMSAGEFGLGNTIVIGVQFVDGVPTKVLLLDGQNRLAGLALAGGFISMNVCFVRCDSDDETKRMAVRLDAQRKRNNLDLGQVTGMPEKYKLEAQFQSVDTSEPRYWSKYLVGASTGLVRMKLSKGRFHHSMAKNPDRKVDIYTTYYKTALIYLNAITYGAMNPSRFERIDNADLQMIMKQIPVMASGLAMIESNRNLAEKFLTKLSSTTPPDVNSPLGGIHNYLQLSCAFGGRETLKSGAQRQIRTVIAMGMAWRAFLANEDMPTSKFKPAVERFQKQFILKKVALSDLFQ